MTNRLPYTTTGGTFSADHTFAQLLEYLRMSEEAAYVLGHYYKAQDDWHQEILPDPPGQVWPQRLTLDYPEDYHLLCAVNRMVGGYMAPWHAIEDLFRRNPDLHRINYFRNAEWKAKQNADRLGIRERVRH